MCLPQKVRNPESVLAEGVHNGHEWAVVANRMGFRCGYVKVEPGHPWHGQEAENVETYAADSDGDRWPDVHGGLTFSAPDTPCEADGPDNGWWVGFDCGHAGDGHDPLIMSDDYRQRANERPDLYSAIGGDVIRTQEYVEQECRKLADQAAAFPVTN